MSNRKTLVGLRHGSKDTNDWRIEMLKENAVEGNWYLATNNFIVDHEGCTIAQGFSPRLARQIVREHNALRAVAPLLPSDTQEKVNKLLESN